MSGMCKIRKEYSGKNTMGPQEKKPEILEKTMKICGVGKMSPLTLRSG